MQDIISKKHIGERLRTLRLNKDLTQAEVSEALGLSRSQYSQVELGKQFPSYGVLSRIAEFYNKDYEWILHGQNLNKPVSVTSALSDAKKKTIISPLKSAIETGAVTISLDSGRIRTILVKLTEQFTYLQERIDQTYINGLPELYLPLSQLSDDHYRAFEVQGDEMGSSLDYQDIAIGNLVEDHTKVSLSGIYVIVLAQSIVIRRITNFDLDLSAFICISDQRRYKPEMIHISDIKELWEVKAKISFRLNQTLQNISQYFQDFEASVNELRDEVHKMKVANHLSWS